jgi:3-hydroxyisobutyrate dehydrogenase-like beta-hydroxyacid dehydrogenase
MCKNIVEKGNLDQPLMIYNRSTMRAVDLSSSLPTGKTEVVKSVPDGVARADIIFTCLSADGVVEDIIQTAVIGDVKGKLFVECSTIHPDTTERVAKLVEEQGAEFVAAPVFGAPAMADAGQLVIVAAGPKASVDKARPYFKGVMGRAVINMVDQPYQKATTLKVIGNTFILNMIEQLAEAHVVAEKCDLGIEYIHKFVENMFPGPYAAYSLRMLTGDYYKRDEPLFSVNLARKDARHAMNIAKAAGARFQNAEIGDAHLAEVQAYAGNKGDIAGIYGAVRQEFGLKFENEA